MPNRYLSYLSLALIAAAAFAQPPRVRVFAEGFRFPERPAIDKQGNIYVVNVQDGVISKVTPDGKISAFADTGGMNQACLFDKEGNLLVCHVEPNRNGILKIDPSGKITEVTTTSDGRPILRTNDMAFGKDGRLYFTAPSSDIIHPLGEIHYIDTDGKTKSFASGLVFANGIAFNADKSYVYVGEERAAKEQSQIWRYKVNADGSADKNGKELFHQFIGRYGVDGMKFDVKGNLWVAMYSESALWCFSPEGKKIDVIPVPGRNPTNLIFAGPDLRTAYVTAADRPGKLIEVKMPVAGQPID
jgi:gluconolactonase